MQEIQLDDIKAYIAGLSDEKRQEIIDAGEVVNECVRVLSQTKHNIVNELLRFESKFTEWQHIPKGDVYDKNSHSQFYYHAHSKAKDKSGPHDDEHGHFHTFLRGKGMPKAMKPYPAEDLDPKLDQADMLTHIAGVAVDNFGRPFKVFTTNRWVTAETWFNADDIIQLLDQYEIDHTQPSWPVNLWITHVMKLFQPQIVLLLKQRDMTIAAWKKEHPDQNVFEDRALEVTSIAQIDIEQQLELLHNIS